MPPNAPDYYTTTPAVAVRRQPNAFARAIDSFLSDIRRNEDVKSPFYKEVLCELSNIAFHDDSPEQNQQAAKALSAFIQEIDCRKRRESLTLRFGEKLRPLVTGLSQFTSVADIAIQAGPKAAVVLYSGARLVLQLAQSFYKCFDTVLDIMAEIGNLLRCYGLFSTAYNSSEDIQDLLVETYKNIVVFWQKAAKLLSRKSYKTVLTGLIKPLDAEWQKCREGLESDCNKVRGLAQATEAELQRQRDLKNEQLRQMEKKRHVVEWLKAGEDDTKLDVRVDLRKYLELRHVRTGKWLYEDPAFKDWIDKDSSTALWYHAGPGSGKTVITSSLISHLQAQGFKVAYFFYSFNDPTRRKSITAIRPLALQIVTQTESIPPQVMKLYEADVANHVFALSDLQTAVLVLQAFLNLQNRIHIILDGLDECHDGLLMRSSLSRLISTHTYGIVKWFFASRNENEIRVMARHLDAAEIEPAPALAISDIKRYLEDRTTRDDLPQCCVESWADASNGNFLWMSLMLNVMLGMGLTCEEEIEEELGKFPTGLTGCYLRSLEQLLQRSKKQQVLARRIFTLLVVAEQPLHLSELSDALGIREGAEDYSEKRIPRPALIEDLCSHLVIFDRASKGNEKDPLLKLAHKSVQDFFNQNPDSLDIPICLRPFFVDQVVANLEVGKACLTYLSYTRYQKTLDNFKIPHEDDHAFLRYAATFWFRHLMRTNHFQELFSSVEEFIRSPAFWTCLIVQCKIAPHLFAQLVEVRGRHYRLGAGIARGPDILNDRRLNFAFPLPDWLDEYSPSGLIIIQEFLRFIKEWHSVLTSYPQALNQCMRDFTGSSYPCRSPSQSKGIRILRLSPSNAANDLSKALLCSLKVEQDYLQASLAEQQDGSQRNLIVRQVAISNAFVSSPMVSQETIYEQIITRVPSHYNLCISSKDNSGRISIWGIELGGLNLIWADGLQMDAFEATGAMEKFKLSSEYDTKTPWVIALKPSMNSNCTVFGFHCFKTARGKQDEDDLGHDTSSPWSESGNESEDEMGDEESAVNYHCLALASRGYPPLWFSWQSDTRMESQVAFAAHPTEPIAIWSQSSFEFCIADLRDGQIKHGILPEPVDIQIRSASATRKEMHFSPDGNTLYYLLCSMANAVGGSVCSISVSSFHFPSNPGELEDLHRSHLNQHITYHVSESVKDMFPTFILTHWTAKYLYLAFPLLSPSPKIVRLALDPASEQNSLSARFETLQDPLYFPTSTPYRNPQLCIQISTQFITSNTPTEHLILALDPDLPQKSEEQRADFASSPVLIIWSISETNNWRDWDQNIDEHSAGLKTDQPKYEMLRGTFVDSEQRFSIPIRSGLDWRKKAFVSCA